MPRIKLTKHEKQSKGRNGWFSPAEIAVLHGPLDTVAVEVWSKRQTGEAPIDLYLTPGDAARVGRALLAAVGGCQYHGPFTGEVCEKCVEFIKAKYGVSHQLAVAMANNEGGEEGNA